MDFANERYVRLYVRETTTWKLLPWEGQALLPQLLRLVDRAGVLDLGGVEPWEAVAAHLPKWPEDVIRVGLDALMKREVVEIRDSLVWPRFLEGQEMAASDAQRARESRAKRRELARHGITDRKRASQDERESNGESHGGTLNHAVPCHAKPESLELKLLPGTDGPGSPGGDAPGSSDDDVIAGVLSAMRDAMRELNPKSDGPRDTPRNRKCVRKPIRECKATLSDWQTVIRRQLRSVRGDREAWKYLSLETLGRPGNFQRLLDAQHLDAPQGRETVPYPELLEDGF